MNCLKALPRLPLSGEIDLTYRCNANCRHCWLRLPADIRLVRNELSFAEIRRIADEARAMGCNRWSISGGEPLLRPDFAEIFDYLTRKAVSYTLNTNGTLITPAIARLLKRPGVKLVALYGNRAEVQDQITRAPGSFDAALRGMAYLKEAGAGFMVQLIPMRANFHQWPEMVRLAERLSGRYRVGAAWLYLSACGAAGRNREISAQRLDPAAVIALDPPNSFEDGAPEDCFPKKPLKVMGQLRGGHVMVPPAGGSARVEGTAPRHRAGQAPSFPPQADPHKAESRLGGTVRGLPAEAASAQAGAFGPPTTLCVALRAGERALPPVPKITDALPLKDERLFAGCIAERRDFHIDPYGRMSFCCFIKDAALRYNLRQGTFQEAWEKFIPALSGKVCGGREYARNCGACELRADCRWCPVYAYLEHRRYSAKVEYLCQVARATRRYRQAWRQTHRRYYQIAGLTIQIDADLPISDRTFAAKFKNFQVAGPGTDTIMIHHHFSLPELNGQDLGKEVYRRVPWAIYQGNHSWIYTGIQANKPKVHSVAVFNQDHTRAQIYHAGAEIFQQPHINALTLFPTDQILLARVLADRRACYLHAAGMILAGKGLLFAGHAGAGKSTLVTKLRAEGELLGDDRMIVRGWPEGFRIHGTWSNGRVPIVSAASAPLSAIMFLEQARTTALTRIAEPKEIVRRLLFLVIRPLVTADWWEKIMVLAEKIVRTVPVYRLQSDKSDKVIELLQRFKYERNRSVIGGQQEVYH
ncbi:MAG: radical SAM protein [Lentisphaerae bacterium]|nr:radical SAM protein [Lentisphaerota bacterium]